MWLVGLQAESRQVQHVVASLTQRLAAAERARDDAGEQLCRAMERAAALEADAVAGQQLRSDLEESKRRVGFPSSPAAFVHSKVCSPKCVGALNHAWLMRKS